MDMTEPEGISDHQTQPLHFAQKGKQVQFREVPKVTRGLVAVLGLWLESGVLLPLCPTTCLELVMPTPLNGQQELCEKQALRIQ